MQLYPLPANISGDMYLGNVSSVPHFANHVAVDGEVWAAAVKTLNKGCDDVVMVLMVMVEHACVIEIIFCKSR